MRKLILDLVKILPLLLFTRLASACPCGCGGAKPLSLHPGENTRAYFYLQEEQNNGYIAQNKKSGADYGPIANQRLGMALAQRISEHFSVFSEFGISRNWHHTSGTDSALSDPSIGLQYSFEEIDLGEAALRISLSGGRKYPVARGINEPSEKDHELDIHGNGSLETLLGVDANLDFLEYGLTTSLTALQREVVGKDSTFGYITQIAGYYQIVGVGRTQLAISRDYLDSDRILGQKVNGSERLSHQIELSQQLRLADKRTMIIAYAKRGVAALDYNSPIYSAIRLGLAQAF